MGAVEAAGDAVCLDVNFRARLWDAEHAARVRHPPAALADIVVASDDEIPPDPPRLAGPLTELDARTPGNFPPARPCSPA